MAAFRDAMTVSRRRHSTTRSCLRRWGLITKLRVMKRNPRTSLFGKYGVRQTEVRDFRAVLLSFSCLGAFLPRGHGDDNVVALLIVHVFHPQFHLVLVQTE